MIPEDVIIAIYHLRCAANCGDSFAGALLDELHRLYDAAGERFPLPTADPVSADSSATDLPTYRGAP